MVSVSDIDKGWAALKSELLKAKDARVDTGILRGSQTKDGEAIADYAAINEYGSAHIPSRPFMAMSFDENKKEISSDINKEYDRILKGASSVETALIIIGQKHADRIKRTITDRNILPRLSEHTIAAKKGSAKTLVDTGALANAVHFSIKTTKGVRAKKK